MSDWKTRLARVASELERHVDTARRQVGERLDSEPPELCVDAYLGYGTAEEVVVRGRVLEEKHVGTADPDDRWWTNLRATMRRLRSSEIPWARVRVRFLGADAEVTADDEGHFEARMRPAHAPPAGSHWHEAEVEVLEPRRPSGGAVVARAEVLVPPVTARFGIISDIDDTVIRTDATNLLRMARGVLLGNVHTRLPFPGVAAFFRALHHGIGGREANPLFYVSSSPWNLHDTLIEFFRLRGVPLGPVTLRDWGISSEELLPTGHASHKLAAIRRILATYPELPFILIGDSGQEDPEIYRDIIHEHPRRILAAYIRNIVPDPLRIESVHSLAEEVAEAGSALVLADDTTAAARHAAEQGWITALALEEIQREGEAEDEEPMEGVEPTDVVMERGDDVPPASGAAENDRLGRTL